MKQKKLPKHILKFIEKAQKNEITEYAVYTALSKGEKNLKNKKIFLTIASDEKKHYDFWKTFTKRSMHPSWFKTTAYIAVSRIFGFAFGTKLMERGEQDAQELYKKISAYIPHAKHILKEEEEHENALLSLILDERLSYIGSLVLGLNDALVELTGALAGLTLAFQNTRLIAVAGLITGVAASFSMAASEYLATKTEKTDKRPVRAAIYTGTIYLATVALLITPYLLLTNVYLALASSLIIAVFIIISFTFYTSVAQGTPFGKRFVEMIVLSFGVASITFLIGFIIRRFLDIEV